MRRTRLVLAVLLGLSLAPGTFVRSPPAKPNYTAPLMVERLEIERELEWGGAGPFTLEAAWHLTSKNNHFGGYSALLYRPDGSLLAGSDAGRLLRLEAGDGANYWSGTFRAFAEAEKRDKRDVDLESMTQNLETGTIWAAYEGSNAIDRYRDLAQIGTRAQPAEMAGWSDNSGPEAMMRLDDGRFIVLAEQRSRFGGDSHEALLFADDPLKDEEPLVFSMATPNGMRPVDMTLTPSGKALILLRDHNWIVPPRWSIALALADPTQIEAGENWEVEVLARLDSPIPIDNFEGIALDQRTDKGCDLWLISDDNFSKFQRTLLLKLDWPTCEHGQSTAAQDAAAG
jgi:hypothetical protein